MSCSTMLVFMLVSGPHLGPTIHLLGIVKVIKALNSAIVNYLACAMLDIRDYLLIN